MNIEPASLSTLQSYQMLTSAVVPRPIAFISTVSEDGIFNLAPFSFFTPICVKPPVICFSIGRRRGEKKDTVWWQRSESEPNQRSVSEPPQVVV